MGPDIVTTAKLWRFLRTCCVTCISLAVGVTVFEWVARTEGVDPPWHCWRAWVWGVFCYAAPVVAWLGYESGRSDR